MIVFNFIKVVFLSYSLLTSLNVRCQEAKPCFLNVDSLFISHFESLDNEIVFDTAKQLVPSSDRYFIHLLMFMSDIETDVESYSLHPLLNRNKLNEYKEWYKKHKDRIKCESIERGLIILKYEFTEETLNELMKMRID